ncbi:GNAT family N-acetyltransferase [Bacillus testis]|uniref:GNAT family N-acetyltransferase n=1 Tax=Bacillus testis TaxID=1622072 RepID=UPI00067F2625|nr:GNAT family N-acetyltransferase [Bacillus testis]
MQKQVQIELFNQEQHGKELVHYRLAEGQLAYTMHPFEALALCQSEKEKIPFVIKHGSRVAGFFILHAWPGACIYSDNDRSLLFRSYSISSEFQGKGIAKQSLVLLPGIIQAHFPDANEIILAVDEGNSAAQKLYKGAGFRDTGKKDAGRSGEMYIWQMYLKDGAL